MKIVELEREGAVVKIRVEIPESELAPEFEKAYQKARQAVLIDGFRPGKVPIELIKKRFGESIRLDAIDEYIKRVYPRLVQTENFKPVVLDVRKICP